MLRTLYKHNYESYDVSLSSRKIKIRRIFYREKFLISYHFL